MPGGKKDPGESDRTCAAREAWEETGIIVTGLEVLYEGECNGYWCVCFTARGFFGEPRNMGEGLVSWVHPEQLVTGAFREFNKSAIQAWREKENGSY